MPENPSSILLIADPGAPAAIAERLSDSLRDALAVESAEDGPCDVSVRYHAYPVDEYAEVSEVIRTIEPGHKPEDIIIYLTDLPRRQGTTPVIAEISLPDRLGVISIPAVGGLSIDRRIKKLAQAVVAEIAGRSDEKTPSVSG